MLSYCWEKANNF